MSRRRCNEEGEGLETKTKQKYGCSCSRRRSCRGGDATRRGREVWGGGGVCARDENKTKDRVFVFKEAFMSRRRCNQKGEGGGGGGWDRDENKQKVNRK